MGKCVRVTQKKYATRPSPPFHAGDCPWQTMEGNDGRSYKSIKTKSGSHVWIPVNGSVSSGTRKNGRPGKGTKKGKIYNIHDYSQYYGHGEFSGKGLKKKAVAMKYKFL